MMKGASVFGGKGYDLINTLDVGASSQGQIEVLQARCSALEEVRATAEAREKIAEEHMAVAVSMKKAAEEAKEAVESEVA